MIDLHRLRTQSKETIALLLKKEPSFDGQKLFELDTQVRQIRTDVEGLRATKNDLAAKAKGGVTAELREQSIQVGKQLKELEQKLAEIEVQFNELYLRAPNLIFDEVPAGNKESNKVIKMVGEKAKFDFEPKHHLEIGTKLGWFDFEVAATLAGSQFVLYKGQGVEVMYALCMFMLGHNKSRGYQMILPPYVVNERSLEIASNFPKFKDQVYKVHEDDLYLIPTSEVSLTNMYREAIFSLEELPKRMTSWTSCFRREAGGYGATERGLIRMHEFEKVELYTFCEPENSSTEQEKMLECATAILDKLGLHYRVSLLAAQDCSFPSAKTYDIEVWMPGQQAYYEVSSISNCTDYQSRRGAIRYRKTAGGKTELVHTLNGSSLALSRLMVALIETYQQKDGSVELPAFLQQYGVPEIK